MVITETTLSAADVAADPNARVWTETTTGGHQGDVLIQRLRGADLEAARADTATPVTILADCGRCKETREKVCIRRRGRVSS